MSRINDIDERLRKLEYINIENMIEAKKEYLINKYKDIDISIYEDYGVNLILFDKTKKPNTSHFKYYVITQQNYYEYNDDLKAYNKLLDDIYNIENKLKAYLYDKLKK